MPQKPPALVFLVVFLENKQATAIRQATLRHLGYQREKEAEGPRFHQKAIRVGKAAGKCHGSRLQCAFEES